jgi:hypothetical protein
MKVVIVYCIGGVTRKGTVIYMDLESIFWLVVRIAAIVAGGRLLQFAIKAINKTFDDLDKKI